jgi:branched-chain amino acid transport system permease protein
MSEGSEMLERLRGVVSARRVAVAAALVLLAAWPYLGASRFALHLGMLFFIWAVVASYWNLLNAIAGILSLGNMGFMALGAYTSAVLAKELGLSPWLTMFIGGLTAMVFVTVLLGLPVLRLRGIYIALLTLVFADALPSVITILRDWTGGGIGLLGVPELLPDLQKWQGYYFAFVFFVVAHAALYRIVSGTTGLAFVALRDAEDFAVALGVDRFRQGLKVFAISAFVTGLAGGLFAHVLGQISPGVLGIEQFLMVVAMWLLGGAGTFFGPILGAAIITFGGEYLRVAGSLRLGLLGMLIVVTVLFFPGGIVQLLEALARQVSRPRRQATSATPSGPSVAPEDQAAMPSRTAPE